MKNEIINKIFNKLTAYTVNISTDIITLGSYDGGHDNGYFDDSEILKLIYDNVLTKNEGDMLTDIIEKKLDYGTYAFDMSVNGEVFFKDNSIIIEGTEEYSEYRDRNENFNKEDLYG